MTQEPDTINAALEPLNHLVARTGIRWEIRIEGTSVSRYSAEVRITPQVRMNETPDVSIAAERSDGDPVEALRLAVEAADQEYRDQLKHVYSGSEEA